MKDIVDQVSELLSEAKADPEVKDKTTGWSKKDVAQRIENGFSNADLKDIKKMRDVALGVFLMQVAEVASEDYLKYLK